MNWEKKNDSEAENMNGMRQREESSDYNSEIPGLALEARIAALERLVAKLKAKSR